MKKLFSRFMTGAAVALAATPAFAQNLGFLVSDTRASYGLTLVFAIFTGYRLIKYWQDFKSESAVADAFPIVILIFLTFGWQTMLGWFGLV